MITYYYSQINPTQADNKEKHILYTLTEWNNISVRVS